MIASIGNVAKRLRAMRRNGALYSRVYHPEPRPPRMADRRERAFAPEPQKLGNIDWLFCDVGRCPARLLNWWKNVLAAGTCPRFYLYSEVSGIDRP